MVSRTHILKSVLSASIGNILEWYEYMLYAYFATVISKLFFPPQDPFVAIILTFSTFAVGLAARPIGGIIFGHIGDKLGRKQMLSVTMLLMSFSTMCIGLLPTYAQVGIYAPILLLVLRITQGVALGGEFGASCVYLFESVPKDRRGFFGSLALTSVGLGLVLSACTIFVVELVVTDKALYSYAWRIPFFISVAGSLLAFYIRKSLPETPDFVSEQREEKSAGVAPLIEMFREYKKALVSMFAMFFTTQTSFFVVFIFGKTMMVDFLHYDMYTAGKFNLLTLISYTISTVIFGWLSDKVNKRYIILCGALGLFVSVYPFIRALENGNQELILFLSVLLGVLIGMTEGTLNPVVAETFPIRIRATSVAFCWNCTAIIFGGVAPVLSMWLIQKSGGVNIVAYYLMTACAVTILSTSYTLISRRKHS